MLDPSHPVFVTGTPQEQAQARVEWRRQRFTAQVMRSNLEEIPRSDLASIHTGLLEDVRDGTFYRPRRDEVADLDHTPSAVAYFVDSRGNPILLERPSGVKSRAELEQRRADRKALRAAKPIRRMRGAPEPDPPKSSRWRR
jgi:hypothetical protein